MKISGRVPPPLYSALLPKLWGEGLLGSQKFFWGGLAFFSFEVGGSSCWEGGGGGGLPN